MSTLADEWLNRICKLLGAATAVEAEATLTTMVKVLTSLSDFARQRMEAPEEQAKQAGKQVLDILEPLAALLLPPEEPTAFEESDDEGLDAFAQAFNARQEELASAEQGLELVRARLQAREALLHATRPGEPGWPERLHAYLLGPGPTSVQELAPRVPPEHLPKPLVPAFIGVTPKGPLLKPVFLDSVEMFDAVFGKEEQPLRRAVASAIASHGVPLVVVVRLENLSEASLEQARAALRARCGDEYAVGGPTIVST